MTQPTLFNEGDTSFAAQLVRQQIVDLLSGRGDVGATRQEILRHVHRQPAYVGSRIDELVAGGEVRLAGGVYVVTES